MYGNACCTCAYPIGHPRHKHHILLHNAQDDSSDIVRQAAVRTLAVLVTLSHDRDKYDPLQALALRVITDRSERVVRATQAMLVPALAQWACELQYLCDRLYPAFCSAAAAIIKVSCSGVSVTRHSAQGR